MSSRALRSTMPESRIPRIRLFAMRRLSSRPPARSVDGVMRPAPS
jgi:hypothetical protein